MPVYISITTLALLVTFEAALLIYALFAVISVIRGAPYVPTTNERLENSLRLARPKPKMRAIDLGSGDGKVVIALAKLGCVVDGYEINPFLVLLSRRKIRKLGLQDKVKIHYQSFWKVDLSQYDLVFVYGITYIMKNLGKKLKCELKPGAKVVSIVFSIPGWQPAKTWGKIYLYQKPVVTERSKG